MSNTAYKLIKIMRREVLRIATKPMYLFCMIIAPLLCYVFFATLMSNGTSALLCVFRYSDE